MKKIKFKLKELPEIVKKYFIPTLESKKIFAFQGPLGAGKTTLIKEFLKQAGVKETITSPTFTYVKTYEMLNGMLVHHFDLYRLDGEGSFIEMGFEEYLNQEGSIAVIEWPEIVYNLLSELSLSDKICYAFLNYCKDDLSVRLLEIKNEFCSS